MEILKRVNYTRNTPADECRGDRKQIFAVEVAVIWSLAIEILTEQLLARSFSAKILS